MGISWTPVNRGSYEIIVVFSVIQFGVFLIIKTDCTIFFLIEISLSETNFLVNCEFEIEEIQCPLKEKNFTKQSFGSQKIHKILSRNLREFIEWTFPEFQRYDAITNSK